MLGSELAEADALGLIILPLPIIWSSLVALDMAEDEALDTMLSSPICCAMAAGAKASAASATNMAR